MGRTTYYISRPAFVVDAHSLIRNSGRQIDWAKVPASYQNADGKKVLPAGTVVSQIAGGKVLPRAATVTLTDVDVAGNVATATLAAHGFVVGEQLRIAGAAAAYVNGIVTVVSVPNANTFTFAVSGADAANVGGTITAARVATAILETSAIEGMGSHSLSGYGCIIGGALFENLLPDASGSPKVLSAEVKAELQAAGTGFAFEAFRDSRAD